jgi:hypothetical protein
LLFGDLEQLDLLSPKLPRLQVLLAFMVSISTRKSLELQKMSSELLIVGLL